MRLLPLLLALCLLLHPALAATCRGGDTALSAAACARTCASSVSSSSCARGSLSCDNLFYSGTCCATGRARANCRRPNRECYCAVRKLRARGVGIIVGAAICGLFVLGAVWGCVWFGRRRRKRAAETKRAAVEDALHAREDAAGKEVLAQHAGEGDVPEVQEYSPRVAAAPAARPAAAPVMRPPPAIAEYGVMAAAGGPIYNTPPGV